METHDVDKDGFISKQEFRQIFLNWIIEFDYFYLYILIESGCNWYIDWSVPIIIHLYFFNEVEIKDVASHGSNVVSHVVKSWSRHYRGNYLACYRLIYSIFDYFNDIILHS